MAFIVAARLDALRGAGHLVRIVDRVELGARLPEAQLDELCAGLDRECAELGAVFVPAIPTAAFEPSPWLGFLVAAHSARTLDAAETLVRARTLAGGGCSARANRCREHGPPGPGQSSTSKGFGGLAMTYAATTTPAIIRGMLKV